MSAVMKNEEDAIGQAVSLTQEAQSDLRTRINQVTDDVAQAAASFQGDGGTAFAQTMQSWNEAVARLTKQLADFESGLSATRQATMAADADQASVFAGIRSSRLG
ncbi:MAG: WXG100 family type VII secretion target [Propioniciclava sp.]